MAASPNITDATEFVSDVFENRQYYMSVTGQPTYHAKITLQELHGYTSYLIKFQGSTVTVLVHPQFKQRCVACKDVTRLLNEMSKAYAGVGLALRPKHAYTASFVHLQLEAQTAPGREILKLTPTQCMQAEACATLHIVVENVGTPFAALLVLEKVLLNIQTAPVLAEFTSPSRAVVQYKLCASKRDLMLFGAFTHTEACTLAESTDTTFLTQYKKFKKREHKRSNNLLLLTREWDAHDSLHPISCYLWLASLDDTFLTNIRELTHRIQDLSKVAATYLSFALNTEDLNVGLLVREHVGFNAQQALVACDWNADCLQKKLTSFAENLDELLHGLIENQRASALKTLLPNCCKYAVQQVGGTCWAAASINLILCTPVLRQAALAQLPAMQASIAAGLQDGTTTAMLGILVTTLFRVEGIDAGVRVGAPERRLASYLAAEFANLEAAAQQYGGATSAEVRLLPRLIKALNFSHEIVDNIKELNSIRQTASSPKIVILSMVSWPFKFKKTVGNYKLIGALMATHNHVVTGVICEDDQEYVLDPNYIYTREKWTTDALNNRVQRVALIYIKQLLLEHKSGFYTPGRPPAISKYITPSPQYSATREHAVGGAGAATSPSSPERGPPKVYRGNTAKAMGALFSRP